VIEHLHGKEDRGPKTLFATHYHELTKLSDSLGRLRNYSVAVKEWNDEIIFVRQVTPGASERSFGIQVARLAGLPDSVVGRAKEILAGLETGDLASGLSSKAQEGQMYPPTGSEQEEGRSKSKGNSQMKPSSIKVKREKIDPSQLELF
jgi:DNA mismatch repair protein MutS